MSFKQGDKNFEAPLEFGFRRALIKRESDRLISVYYITPDNKYLKDISEVCDWLEEEKHDEQLNRRDFNFIARKWTSHENEVIIDYNSLPEDIRNAVIEKKKSIAPNIMTIDNDETLVLKKESTLDAQDHNKINYKDGIFDKDSMATDALQGQISISASEITIKYENMIPDTAAQNKFQVKIENTVNDSIIPSNILSPVNVVRGENMDSSQEVTQESDNEIVEVIDKNISISPTIITIEDDEDDEMEGTNLERTTAIPSETIKIETKLFSMNTGDHRVRKRLIVPERETNENNDPLTEIPQPVNGKDVIIMAPKRMRLDDTPIEFDDNSLTLSVESSYKEESLNNTVYKPRYSYEYALAIINMNSLVELGTNCHTDRLQEVFNGNADPRILKTIKSYCGNHCAFDTTGHPRIAFECDVCLILWHNDCIGHRRLVIGPSTLMVCDNCFMLHQNLNVELPNIFCNIDKLLQSEYKPEKNSSPNSVSIPTKLESIMKLCKVQWVLENIKKPIVTTVSVDYKTAKKPLTRLLSQDFPKDCRFFIKVFIRQDMIIHELKEDHVKLKFNSKEVDTLANIFADSRAELLINDQNYMIIISKIAIKIGELVIPVAGRILKPGCGIFHVYEYGQDRHPEYVKRCENLRLLMNNGLRMLTDQTSVKTMAKTSQDARGILYNHLIKPKPVQFPKLPQTVSVSQLTTKMQTNRIILSSSTAGVVKNIPTVRSQNHQMNAIPVNVNQMKNYQNIIKIRQRKQDFSSQKMSSLGSNSSTIQYYHLVDLPFSILEQILTSKCLSTMDKLNCRLANRVLKCAVDAGRVWSKVVINPGSVTGLQIMFDFFSQRNVKSMTFKIDFQESFGIEFFTSFISRLKMYPDSFHLEKMSIKLTGLSFKSPKFSLSVQDILNSISNLKVLSLSSTVRIVVGLSKIGVIRSKSLETLKLKNIDNIYQVLRTDEENTPKLRVVRCGDWSYVTNMNIVSLLHVTRLRLDFSDNVNLLDLSLFNRLTKLEYLIISRPGINEVLMKLLDNTLHHRSLKYFRLDSNISTKEQVDACSLILAILPQHIAHIDWNIFVGSLLSVSEPSFKKNITELVPLNVHIRVQDI